MSNVSPYWIEPAGVCVEAESPEAAIAVAKEHGKRAEKADVLPYPANPRLTHYEYVAGAGACPSFCYSPLECKGRTSCPKRRACSD